MIERAGFSRPFLFLQRMAENLDFRRGCRVLLCDNSQRLQRAPMFDDMFNFKKQRTLKESVGFFLFHAMMIMGVQGFAMMLGF
jgi:hypothetical protein